MPACDHTMSPPDGRLLINTELDSMTALTRFTKRAQERED